MAADNLSPDVTLTPTQWEVMDHLINGDTQREAARKAGCHYQTVGNWVQDVRFQAEMSRRRIERYQAAMSQLQSAVGDAVGLLATTARAVKSQFRFDIDEDGAEVVSRMPDAQTLGAGLRAASDILDRTGVLKGEVRVVEERREADVDDVDTLLAKVRAGREIADKAAG